MRVFLAILGILVGHGSAAVFSAASGRGWSSRGVDEEDTSNAKSPRQLLSVRRAGRHRRRLHLRGGLCITASQTYSNLGGHCKNVWGQSGQPFSSRATLMSQHGPYKGPNGQLADYGSQCQGPNAKRGQHGNYNGVGACSWNGRSTSGTGDPNTDCLNKPIDTSATYVAGQAEYVNFFTCSYHYGGGNFDGCMGGNAQSTQLTFALTYSDDGSFQRRKSHGMGDRVEIHWNRCHSRSDCLRRWREAGYGNNGRATTGITGRGNSYEHQMGWNAENDYSTQNCWGKYKSTMFGGTVHGCNYWHISSFSGASINSGSANNMNNPGRSGVSDSIMVAPKGSDQYSATSAKLGSSDGREFRNYWSSQGRPSAINGQYSQGGLDIDMLYRDYGPGWYTATIGGFGCEIDTDTTWFRIKGSSCEPGTYCDGTTSGVSRTDTYGNAYAITGCAGTCVACQAGRYLASQNGATCEKCPAGKDVVTF